MAKTAKELAEDARCLSEIPVYRVCDGFVFTGIHGDSKETDQSIRGKEVRKELQAGSIALDLPKGHDLRSRMAGHEATLKEKSEMLRS